MLANVVTQKKTHWEKRSNLAFVDVIIHLENTAELTQKGKNVDLNKTYKINAKMCHRNDNPTTMSGSSYQSIRELKKPKKAFIMTCEKSLTFFY